MQMSGVGSRGDSGPNAPIVLGINRRRLNSLAGKMKKYLDRLIILYPKSSGPVIFQISDFRNRI